MTNFGKSIVLAAILQSVVIATGAQEVGSPVEPAVATLPGLTETDFKTVANGSFDLSVGANSPIYAEFQDSPELTARLRAVLGERGFALAESKESAKSILRFRGEVVLIGGPVFYRGLKLSVAEATDKAFKAEEKDRPTYRSDVIRGVAGMAVNAASYSRSMSNFMQGLRLGAMASAITESTGLKGWLNSKVSGDPRGICLSRCADWKKVNQTAYMWASLETGGEKKEVRIMSKAFSETVAPEDVITFAVGKAVEQINVSGDRPVMTSSIEGK